ncbi:MAG: hypothetical protein MPJ24_02215 [Pirellulaceae bacterium]|nr:hypothetical protein [Pirellulaceae bacterium]
MREHQGLQIGLILSLLLTVGLLVSTVLCATWYSGAAEELAKKSASLRETQQSNGDLENLLLRLKYMAGDETEAEGNIASLRSNGKGGEHDVVENLEKTFDTQMQLFGNANATGAKNFPKLVAHLEGQVTNLKKSLFESQAREKQLVTDKTNLESALKAEIATAQAGQKQASDDLKEQRANFNTDLADYEKKATLFQEQAVEAGQKMTALVQAHNEVILEKDQQITGLQSRNSSLQKKLDELGGKPGLIIQPDAQISWVNERTKTVWLNVGRADGLQRQMLFNVYDQSVNSFIANEKKAVIEVTKILDDHSAEARIINLTSSTQPIMVGDITHTPIWAPGRFLRFAIVGEVDFDNDGNSDLSTLKKIIELHNGKIDVVLHSNGEQEGAISVDTSYVLRGDVGKGSEGFSSKLMALTEAAKDQGIENLTVKRFLEKISYRGEEKATDLRTLVGDIKIN